MAHQRVNEAMDILRQIGMPKQQTNERSALTLLALLALTPDRAWADIEAPFMGITPMMEFMALHYEKNYAPNSRETVRRQTIHQFMQAGIAVQNPDDPQRPTNSGNTVYQVPARFIEILRQYGTDSWNIVLQEWLDDKPTLVDRYERARQMNMIPVTLPNGSSVELSPGGQNPLIKAIVEDFCPRYTPAGQVLYIGDTGDKFAVWETNTLAGLGVTVDEHGKMPDVVVLDTNHNWLVLVEAVTSHGPIDPKRREELAAVFGSATAGIVYVTAFFDRETFKNYLGTISWATEVWVAETPTHLIHFDGDRFLGPYE